MKRLFLDTNFILDYLEREEYKESSQQFLEDLARQNYKCYVSYLSIANFAYIERKKPYEIVRNYIKMVIELFEVVPNNKKQIQDAIEIEGPDFEDILQYQSAVSSKCDFIITRNEKHFAFSNIPVLSPTDFREKYLNSN
ncbi:MAG: PIN domain-containing protein [Muribaculaceae bacterium]|nr:PIN domain-containing protein [Muribaculaceae bacterium]